MLIIRATSSLTKKIKASVSSTINHEVSFISEWYAKDFRFERANLVLFVNAKTFLPVVVKAASYHDVSLRFTGELGRVLVACGFNYPLGNLSAEVIYGKPIDKSILGVLNRFVQDIEFEQYHGELSGNDALGLSLKLANGLVGSDRWDSPVGMFAKEIGVPVPSRGPLRLL